MKKTVKSLLFLLILVLSPALFAATGLEIAQAYDNIKDPASTHMALQMNLIDADGSVSTRMIEQWGIEKNKLADSIMVFRSPASVKDTRFLQVENTGRGDDKWIYLPAMKRVRRIASSDGSKSFMGSDVTYDDMETRAVDRDTHDLVREETFGSWNCDVVKEKAVDPSDTQYSYRLTWFDKASHMPVKVEMYDKQENLYKVLTVKSMKNVSGYWTPMDSIMKNVQTGHSTELKVLQVVYDSNISEKMFTTQFLQNGR